MAYHIYHQLIYRPLEITYVLYLLPPTDGRTRIFHPVEPGSRAAARVCRAEERRGAERRPAVAERQHAVYHAGPPAGAGADRAGGRRGGAGARFTAEGLPDHTPGPGGAG